MSNLKDRPVIVYLDQTLSDVLDDVCRQTGQSASGYLRALLLTHFIQTNKLPAEVIALMAGAMVATTPAPAVSTR